MPKTKKMTKMHHHLKHSNKMRRGTIQAQAQHDKQDATMAGLQEKLRGKDEAICQLQYGNLPAGYRRRPAA